MLKLDTHTFTGSYEQIGYAHGETYKALIQELVSSKLTAANRYFLENGYTNNDVQERLYQVGLACYKVFQQYSRVAAVEHEAISRAAGVDPVLLYVIANYTDMRDVVLLSTQKPDAEGCTAMVVPACPTTGQSAIAGQTWDLNAEDIDYVIASRREPIDGVKTFTVHLVGCAALMGMNEHGIAVGTTNLKTYGSKIGVGYTSIIQNLLSYTQLDSALKQINQVCVSGAHSYFISNNQQSWRIELTGFSHVMEKLSAPYGWSNHCLVSAHQRQEAQKPTLSSSTRFNRVNQCLQSCSGLITTNHIIEIMKNRSDGYNSINRYPEDKDYAATNACFVANLADKTVFACRGPADRGIWVKDYFV